jgi:large subunit ribosomal protein L9
MPGTMKLLLNESIRNLGRVGDVVEVSAGYARNYLLPHGLAVEPTKANLKKIESRRQEVLRLESEKRAQQAVIIEKLAGIEVMLERRANEQGHLFGSVSATEIAKALQGMGYAIEGEDVLLPGKLDHIEKYTVTVRFAEDLKQEIKVWVAPDPESKQLIEESRRAIQRAHEAEKAAAAAEKAAASGEAPPADEPKKPARKGKKAAAEE